MKRTLYLWKETYQKDLQQRPRQHMFIDLFGEMLQMARHQSKQNIKETYKYEKNSVSMKRDLPKRPTTETFNTYS